MLGAPTIPQLRLRPPEKEASAARICADLPAILRCCKPHDLARARVRRIAPRPESPWIRDRAQGLQAQVWEHIFVETPCLTGAVRSPCAVPHGHGPSGSCLLLGENLAGHLLTSMSASILPGKFGQGTVSVTLSKEEWEAFEDSAERMGKALVGSLRSILDEVHLVLDSNSAGSVRPGHGSPAAPPSPEEGEPEGGEDAAARLAAKRKADYSDFVNKMRDPRAAPLRNAAQVNPPDPLQ